MFGKPRQLETETALYDAATKILMRRAPISSCHPECIRRGCTKDLNLVSLQP